MKQRLIALKNLVLIRCLRLMRLMERIRDICSVLKSEVTAKDRGRRRVRALLRLDSLEWLRRRRRRKLRWKLKRKC